MSETSVASEPYFEVVWPLSSRGVTPAEAARRLPDLNGKVVCELWDVMFRGEVIYPRLREHLRSQFPGARFVDHTEFGDFHGARDRAVIADLPERLRAHGADAAIVGIGA